MTSISARARACWGLRIGNNVMIGSNAVVYRDIPDDAVVVLDRASRSFLSRQPPGGR